MHFQNYLDLILFHKLNIFNMILLHYVGFMGACGILLLKETLLRVVNIIELSCLSHKVVTLSLSERRPPRKKRGGGGGGSSLGSHLL